MRTGKEIRKIASDLLVGTGTFHISSIGMCMSIMAVVLPFLIQYCFTVLFHTLELKGFIFVLAQMCVFFICALILVLLSFPTVMGYQEAMYRIYKGSEEATFSDIFKPFKSKANYIRSLKSGSFLALNIFALFGIPYVAVFLLRFPKLPAVIENEYLIFIFNVSKYVFSFLTGILLFAVFALIEKRYFFVNYFVFNGLNFKDSVKLSKRAFDTLNFKFWKFVFGFTPLILLSIFTVCTAFAVYVGPLMIFAYFIYADMIFKNNFER